jgi:hypothetical protein
MCIVAPKTLCMHSVAAPTTIIISTWVLRHTTYCVVVFNIWEKALVSAREVCPVSGGMEEDLEATLRRVDQDDVVYAPHENLLPLPETPPHQVPRRAPCGSFVCFQDCTPSPCTFCSMKCQPILRTWLPESCCCSFFLEPLVFSQCSATQLAHFALCPSRVQMCGQN